MKKTHTIIFAIACLVVAGLAMETCRRLQAVESALHEQTAQTVEWKNKAGQTVIEKEAAILETKRDAEKLYKTQIERLEKELGVSKRKIKSFQIASIEATGSGTSEIRVDTVIKDCLPDSARVWINISDDYLNANVETKHPFDQVTWDYVYSDEIVLATTEDKNGWKITGTLKNPNARIVNIQGVTIQKKKKPLKWFLIGAGAGLIGGLIIE